VCFVGIWLDRNPEFIIVYVCKVFTSYICFWEWHNRCSVWITEIDLISWKFQKLGRRRKNLFLPLEMLHFKSSIEVNFRKNFNLLLFEFCFLQSWLVWCNWHKYTKYFIEHDSNIFATNVWLKTQPWFSPTGAGHYLLQIRRASGGTAGEVAVGLSKEVDEVNRNLWGSRNTYIVWEFIITSTKRYSSVN